MKLGNIKKAMSASRTGKSFMGKEKSSEIAVNFICIPNG